MEQMEQTSQMNQPEQTHQSSLKPWHGILAFVAMMIIFIIVAPPIQRKLGLIGVAITELILLAMAIGAALIFRQNLKEVFPIKLPKLREVFGTLLFWMGGFLLAMIGTVSLTLLFPQEMTEVSDGLNDVMSSEGVLLGILIVSFMPAICEEAVHRGFILHTFKGVKRPWITVLSMGVIFGVFHLDPYRFVPTAILGACMTWVMLKTENMVLPAIYHGVNNLLPVLLSFALQNVTVSAETIMEDGETAVLVGELLESGWPMVVSGIGSYLMLGMVALPLMFAGTVLMKKKGEKIENKHVTAIFVVAGVMLFAGLAMVAVATAYLMAKGIGM